MEEALDSDPKLPPNFDDLPPITDTDEESESDDDLCSCPECSSETSDEEIPREKNEYNWYKRRLHETENMHPTQFLKNFGMSEENYNILYEELENDLPLGLDQFFRTFG